MTPSDFKSWFAGFVDGMGNQPPNAEQWKRIRDQIEKMSAVVPMLPAGIPILPGAHPLWKEAPLTLRGVPISPAEPNHNGLGYPPSVTCTTS